MLLDDDNLRRGINKHLIDSVTRFSCDVNIKSVQE